MKNKIVSLGFAFILINSYSQADLIVGSSYQLNLQRQNNHGDAWILHNAQFNSGTDLLQWSSTHASFGSRGIRFSYASGGGIFFYADNQPTTSGSAFTPYTRLYIGNNGNIGIGTVSPSAKLHIVHASNTAYENAFRITSNNSQQHWPLIISTNGKSNFSGFFNSNDDISLYLRKDDGAVNTYLNSDGDSYINGGNVGIGTTNPTQKLEVNGTIYSKEVKVDLQAGTGPDYVFEPNYKLLSLEEIKSYIEKNKHLPEVPSAKEMETNGVNVSEMNMLLLKKIEELTLHLIEQNKINEEQKLINNSLLEEIKTLKCKIK